MNLLLTAVIVALSAAAGIGVFLLVRRFLSPHEGFFTDGDRAAGVFGVLATAFAVLLGFVVYLAYLSYDTARAGAQAEATSVLQQYELAQLFPQADGVRLSGLLVCYGRAVVGVEWPQLQHGTKPAFNPWAISLFEALKAVKPVTPSQQAAYSKWLDETTDREQARLDRVHSGDGVVPTPLWVLLFGTAALVLVFAFFFADRQEGIVPQAVIAGTVVSMLVASMLVIGFLDHPYSKGSGGLKPTDMTRTLGQIEAASKVIGLHVPIPCDAVGRPL